MAPTDKSVAASVSERQGVELCLSSRPSLCRKNLRSRKARDSKEIETNVPHVLLITHKRRVP